MGNAPNWFERLAPNPTVRTGVFGTAYVYAYAALVVPYGLIFRRAEIREWERQRDANARWGAAVFDEKLKVENEIFARDGTRWPKNQEDVDRYNLAGKHLRLEDFLEPR